jgi:glycosyltransferase involved in cell wall biosynthesis
MASKKKNLLIIGSTAGCYGGMEAFMMTIAKAAKKWPEYNVRLCFKLVKNNKQDEALVLAANNCCEEVFFVRSNSRALIKLLAWSDILHVQNTPPDVIFSSWILRKKIFLTVHNWRRKHLNLHNFLWGISVRLADQRWFNSNFVYDTWDPAKKLPNSSCVYTVSNLPKTYLSPLKRKGFVFIGRWIPNKGIEEILKAYSIAAIDKNLWPLIILGDGPLRPTVERLIEELDLQTVIMPGFVDVATKEKYLSSAKWLLAPANTKEDLGLTPIEARSVGVPSIVTRDGGLPEAGGRSAILAEPGDAHDLANCMQQASQMNDSDYIKRSELAKNSLVDFLNPIEFYRNAYKN